MFNVIEHLTDPKAAVNTAGRLLRPGGLFMVVTPFLWRYHANPTYGDYFRYTTRGLEVLCGGAGLNPVLSFYKYFKNPGVNASKLYRGTPEYNIDVPVQMMDSLMAASAICYKPRKGERLMAFQEVGTLDVKGWPRFDLDFSAPLSESEKPIRW